MSESHAEAARAYIRTLADRLGLRDWKFVVTDHPGETGPNLLDVATVPGRRLAHVRILPLFYEVTAAERRHAVVHELFHCHMNPLLDHAEMLRPPLGGQTFDMFFQDHVRRLEEGLDAIAGCVAPDLPMLNLAIDARLSGDGEAETEGESRRAEHRAEHQGGGRLPAIAQRRGGRAPAS
jgi:hypothetical protein